jgi:membrane protein implicated in regulation of membrane protease activity
MIWLVVIGSWLMLGLVALATWFLITSAGLDLNLLAASLVTLIGTVLIWRLFRRRSQSPS